MVAAVRRVGSVAVDRAMAVVGRGGEDGSRLEAVPGLC